MGRNGVKKGSKPALADGSVWSSLAAYMSRNIMICLGMDRRSLAFFRVGLALTIIGDLINRANEGFRAHYTDYGLFPRKLVLSAFSSDKYLCIHMLSGGMVGSAVIWFIHGLFAMGLLFGFYTKTCQIATWAFHISLMERIFTVLHSGDVYMGCILFFQMFLPLGSCCSIDNTFYKKRPQHARSRIVLNVATVALIAQVMMLYMVSVFFKIGAPWHQEGTAVYYAIQLDYFRMPLGDFLLWLHFHGFRWILPLLTKFTIIWEYWGPLILISPIWPSMTRIVGVLGFFALHLGLALCLRLGEFFWICFVTFFTLIPPWFWDSVLFPLLRRRRSRVGMRLYVSDVMSPWPTRLARFLATFFLLPETTVLPMEAFAKSSSVPTDYSGEAVVDSLKNECWLVLELGAEPPGLAKLPPATPRPPAVASDGAESSPGREIYRWNRTLFRNFGGVVAIFRESPLLWPWAPIADAEPVSKAFGSFFDWLWVPAKNSFPEAGPLASDSANSADSASNDAKSPLSLDDSSEPLDTAVGVSLAKRSIDDRYAGKTYFQIWLTFSRKFFRNIVPFVLILYCLSDNMTGIDPNSAWAGYNDALNGWGDGLHITQNWRMFAPQPPNANGWHVMEAFLEDGRQVEIFKERGLFNWQYNVPFSLDPPRNYKSYSSHRWFKYWENGFNSEWAHENGLRLNFGQWVCREWNTRHEGPERLKTFYVHWIIEWFDLEGVRTRTSPETLWHHIC